LIDDEQDLNILN